LAADGEGKRPISCQNSMLYHEPVPPALGCGSAPLCSDEEGLNIWKTRAEDSLMV